MLKHSFGELKSYFLKMLLFRWLSLKFAAPPHGWTFRVKAGVLAFLSTINEGLHFRNLNNLYNSGKYIVSF